MMADTSARPSPDDPTPGRLQLPLTHTGSLFRGPTASVYYHRQPPFASKEECYVQTKLVITFDLASGILRRRTRDAWQVEQLAGRGVYWFPPHVAHEVRWEQEAELVEIYYESTFWRELPSKNVPATLERAAQPAAIDDPVIWDLARAICLWCSKTQPEPSVISDIGVLIGKRLFHNHAKVRDGDPSPRLSHEQRRKLDEFIQVNIANQFGVRDLARVVALSAPHLTTLCRNTTGKPPMEYVRECRLRKAHAMARSGRYRRGEIARHCGFYDGSHLNREFKKFFKHPLGVLL